MTEQATPTRLTGDHLFELRIPSQPAISPDGGTVVYVLSRSDKDADADQSCLWLVRAEAGSTPRRLTHGTADSAPAFSPDGSQVAFLRADGGAPQIWLLPLAGGEPEQLTALPGGAGAPVWSPDGTRIAFTAMVDTDAAPDEDDAVRAARAGEPIVIDRLGYRIDGAGLVRGLRAHLHVVDAASGTTTQLTDGDWHAGPPAWSPDGSRLAYTASTELEAEITLQSPVYVLDPDAPSAGPVTISGAGAAYGPVAWASADEILAVGRPDVSIGHNQLRRLPVAGGSDADVLPGVDRNVMPGGPGYPGGMPQVTSDGSVVVCLRDRGCTHAYIALLDGDGGARPLVAGTSRVVSGLSVAHGAQRAAVVIASADSFGEVAVVDLGSGAETALTEYGTAGIDLYPATERTFTVSDGTEVHGWLIRDPEADTPGPLLVDVHGGPHNAWNTAADPVHLYHQMLVAQGWTILLLNPRGSDGYGERFFTAALGGWGLADQGDILGPLDRLVDEGVADPQRLALAGYSYGGYMTCWLTGQTDRFAAAVAGGVVSDLAAMAGMSDAGPVFSDLELGGTPYDAPEKVAAQSPSTHLGRVSTPTLVLHGAADERCPVGQADLWFAGLRYRGVPSQMVLYPGASHLFILNGKPSHRLDYNRRIVEWVTRHTPPREDPVKRPALNEAHWHRRLSALMEKYHVPGASLGIAFGDETIEVAHGTTNVETGVPVTTDTLFQIGSITKVWTATVVMALVDQGKIDLDEPVVTYLPELKLADDTTTATVTMRHLLTHTSGIDGDYFEDFGRGDDCLERYVGGLAGLAMNHPIGATWSYCNSGFTVAARVVEKVTGLTWDAAMKELLYTPLGLERTVTLPEEVLLHRSATGHVHQGDEPARRAPAWMLPRSLGPAGLIASTVGDVLAFARMHLRDGKAADGTGVLDPATVQAMATEQVRLPDPHTIADSWGIGWFRLDWNGTRLIGHDGNTIGQAAFLRVLPEHDLAVTMLTNGGHTRDLYETLIREIFRELAGIEMQRPLTPPEPPVTADITAHVGRYERTSVRFEVFSDGGPRMKVTVDQSALGMDEEVREYDLVPIHDDLYLVREPGVATWMPVTFYQLDDGARYMHFGVRATPKVS